jgi:NADH:ubiquinone oxidoreductase subunit C
VSEPSATGPAPGAPLRRSEAPEPETARYAEVPGLVETKAAHGEVTVVVEPGELTAAATYLRDELGFWFLSDISATDYLGWADRAVAGYIGTPAGRDLNSPSSQGFARKPDPKPKRFAMSYHLLALREGAPRVRLQVWLDENEPIASVVPVWPTADWHEREAWDLMGIAVEGHPNLSRILLEDDWVGHPLRKDYPIGGEPVRFSPDE